MVIFRLIGFLLIVFALMLLGADVVSTLEKQGETIIRSLDQILLLFGADATPWLERTLPPQAANGALVLLSWPGWAVLGIPGAVLGMIASGPRKKRYTPPPAPPISR